MPVWFLAGLTDNNKEKNMNTTSFAIVGLYAGLNALIILWLSLVISKLRRKYKVSIGDGGN